MLFFSPRTDLKGFHFSFFCGKGNSDSLDPSDPVSLYFFFLILQLLQTSDIGQHYAC